MLRRLDDDVGKLILRLTLGVLLLPHGIAKLVTGIGGIHRMLANAGWPEFLAYGVFVGEIGAPVMLIAGFYARWAAIVVVINMVFAIVLAHGHEIFHVQGFGGWSIELQAFFLLTALALIFTGPGVLAVNRR
jgi:putative oxidoreductase